MRWWLVPEGKPGDDDIFFQWVERGMVVDRQDLSAQIVKEAGVPIYEFKLLLIQHHPKGLHDINGGGQSDT